MITIRVDTSKLEAKLLAASVAMKKSLGQVLRAEGRLLAVALAKYTQPFGLGDAARKKGENTVANDYHRVYPALASEFILNNISLRVRPAQRQAVATRIEAYVRAGNTGAIMKMLTDMKIGYVAESANPQVHASRWGRGRLHQGTTQAVIDQKTVNNLIKQAQAVCGYAKAGWATCAKQLGGTRGGAANSSEDIKEWVSRHDAPGRVIDKTNEERPSLTLVNMVNYTNYVLSDAGMRKAIAERAVKIQGSIDRAIKFGVKDK